MFQIAMIGGFNPFEWDDLNCPGCGGIDFISYSMTGTYCQGCNARFVIRMTGGDPGLVVDAWAPETIEGKTVEKYFCLILKVGEYCSGWMPGDTVKSIGYPTQEQWEKYQENLEILPGLGSTINARFAILQGDK